MERTDIFVDPEEDEIFFYPVSEKEPQNKVHKRVTSPITEKCFQQDGACSTEIETSLKKVEKPCIVLEEILDVIVPMNDASPVHSPDVKCKEDCIIEPVETSGQGATIKLPKTEEEVNLKLKKDEKSLDMSQKKLNIQIDHNYSTPVKNVIDKNILKMPKSVVKADKDGGFLKLLSEIALVKAEADENTVQKLTDMSLGQELTNDDNKENEQSDNETISMNRSFEGSPVKSNQVSLVRKLNCENLRRNSAGGLEALDNTNSENADTTDAFNCEMNKTGDKVIPQDENEKNNYLNSTTMPLLNYSECNTTIEPESKDIEDSELQIWFEKLNDKVGCHNIEVAEKLQNTELEKVAVKQHDCDTVMKTSWDTVNSNSDHDQHSMSFNIQDKSKQHCISNKPPILLVNGVPETEQKECSKVLADDDAKNRLRRNTMRLLQGLNDIINNEQGKGDASTGLNSKLCEEAAKVIDALKAVGMEDSICSSDQYFDLDKLNTSFLSIDLSSILNDTISNTLRNEDLETLLTKITSGTLESSCQRDSKESHVEKENLCEIKFDDNLRMLTPQKVIQNHSKETPIINNTGSFKNTSVTPFKTPFSGVKCGLNERPMGHSSSASKKNYMNNKPLQQLQNGENGIKACLSAQKGKNTTKIPKLASTTSKIPVNMRDKRMESAMPDSAKLALTKPSIHRAQRNLKFCNIESPVRAYIKSTTPILLSNVKARPGQVLTKPLKSCAKVPAKAIEKEDVLKSEVKANIPFSKYKSAIPLKLEKTPESRIPGLTSKIQKLIGQNSPVIAKHERRIQVGPATNEVPSGNESSVFVSTNEVSVIVRKVAKIPNDK